MLEALVFFTFIAGVFTGIGILAMIFVYLVHKDDKKRIEQSPVRRAKYQMEKVQKDPSVPTQGPILN